MGHEQGQQEQVGQLEEGDLELIEKMLERLLGRFDEFEARFDEFEARFDEFGDRLCGRISDLGNRIESVTDGSHLRSPGRSGLSEMMHAWQRETSPWTC